MTQASKPAKKPVPALVFFLFIAALVALFGYVTDDDALLYTSIQLAVLILAVTVAAVLFVRAAKRAGMAIQVRRTYPCGQSTSSTTYRLWGINHATEAATACPTHGEKCKPFTPAH